VLAFRFRRGSIGVLVRGVEGGDARVQGFLEAVLFKEGDG
jgi:hypothetical protein